MFTEFVVVLMKKITSWCLILIIAGLVWLQAFCGPGQVPAAIALIQQEQEGPGQWLLKTRHRFKDSQGRTWQTVLYKRIKDEQSLGVNLRLVGFLGAVAIDHPAKLEILTHSGELLLAPDQFANGAPSENVGEYDFTQILSHLEDYQAFTLRLTLHGDRETTLTIPSPVSLEWQELNSVDGPKI
jgi:hypothetical protein